MLKFEPKKQSRSKLYYDQYQYCLVFRLPHAHFLRELDHDKIVNAVYWRNYRRQNRSTWISAVTREQEEHIHTTCDFLLRQKNYKKVVSGNGIWIYTNDIASWSDIQLHAPVAYSYSSEAVVCLPKDTVVHIKPKHQYRTYFKNTYFDQDQSDLIRKFFKNRADVFYPSPSFQEFLADKRQWLSDYNFVDHNDSRLDLMISLACPGIVSKTMPIVARDK